MNSRKKAVVCQFESWRDLKSGQTGSVLRNYLQRD
jgi:hypothetical protein